MSVESICAFLPLSAATPPPEFLTPYPFYYVTLAVSCISLSFSNSKVSSRLEGDRYPADDPRVPKFAGSSPKPLHVRRAEATEAYLFEKEAAEAAGLPIPTAPATEAGTVAGTLSNPSFDKY